MEALAAVGAASSILQLLDFTVKLIKTGKEIRESGCTLENEALETIYERMQTFLQPVDAIPLAPVSTTFSREIISSAKSAQKSCGEILGFLRELKVKNGGRKRWGSVIVAFRSMLKRRKIRDIEARLKMELNHVSLEMSRITCDEIQKLRKQAADTLAHTNAGRTVTDQALDNLSKRLENLHMESRDAGETMKVETLCQMAKQLRERIEELNAIQIAKSFLSSLYFPCLDRRHEAIPPSYANTFKWIYDIPRFRDWMERGSGIFWIHGKPGAGKSTLMKFLADNPRTKGLLEVWAAPCKGIVAAHYFWNMGSPMQKSMRGLLQTLASEILHKAPHLVPLARRLQTSTSSSTEFSELDMRADHGQSKEWTIDELSRILRGLAQGDTGDVKLCLFVDGLDEFEGDHQEVCEILGSLATSQHIKLCVSSRPWNVFKDEFGQDCTKHLAVHELTASDMETFVRGKLNAHRNWNTNRASAAEKAFLVRDIRTRANGVFLWVTLVTQSLCNGLTNHDNIHDLKRRLQNLPTDLGDLFKHILHRIDPVYMHKSAEFLQIALHDSSSAMLPLEAYYYHERDFEQNDPAVMWPVGNLSLEELSPIRELAGRRITALTGGLLEANFHDSAGEARVDFLHRTVADFLKAEDINKIIQSRTRPGFDVYLALTKLYAISINSAPSRNDQDGTRSLQLSRLYAILDNYIPKVSEGGNTRLAYGYLDEIERHSAGCLEGEFELSDFKYGLLQSALRECRSFKYIAEKLSKNSGYFPDMDIYTVDAWWAHSRKRFPFFRDWILHLQSAPASHHHLPPRKAQWSQR